MVRHVNTGENSDTTFWSNFDYFGKKGPLMKKAAIVFVLFFCLGSTVFVRNSHAAYYKYTDKDGVICFADNLQVIPEQYRAQAVIVETEAKDDEIKAAGGGPAVCNTETAPAAVAGQEGKGPRPLSTRLMISGAVGLGALLIFVVISSQAELKENKKLLSLVRGALMAVVSLYLVVAHTGDVMTIFGAAGKTVEKAQRQSEEKGKKAAQAMKSLNALFEEAQKAQKSQETSTAGSEDGDK